MAKQLTGAKKAKCGRAIALHLFTILLSLVGVVLVVLGLVKISNFEGTTEERNTLIIVGVTLSLIGFFSGVVSIVHMFSIGCPKSGAVFLLLALFGLV